MTKLKIVNDDPFYSDKQDGKVDVKCSKILEEALRAAAPQLNLKYSELVRRILKQGLIALALEGQIQLPQNVEIKSASGE